MVFTTGVVAHRLASQVVFAPSLRIPRNVMRSTLLSGPSKIAATLKRTKTVVVVCGGGFKIPIVTVHDPSGRSPPQKVDCTAYSLGANRPPHLVFVGTTRRLHEFECALLPLFWPMRYL